MAGVLAFLRWAIWLIVVVALVLAPLAWAPIEIFPAAWNWFALALPEVAAKLQGTASAGAFVGSYLTAVEPYKNLLFLAVFVAATIGVIYGGPYAPVFCRGFRYFGWAVVVFSLNLLSYALWDAAAAGTAVVFANAPDIAALVTSSIDWLNALLGPVGMAALNFFLVVFVIFYGWGTLLLVGEGMQQLREWLQSAFIGQVDPVFPRATRGAAEACARARRTAIGAYLNNQVLPPAHHTQVTFSNGRTPFRFAREYIERRQEIRDVDPYRVVAFLEVPRGSAIKAQEIALDSDEEVVGQYVRLRFEAETARGDDGQLPLDDTLMLLLGRVVDAAILADQQLDSQRENAVWPAMPFFDRIYVEYRPILPPFDCFLGPILGDALPARVVIETQYPDVFRRAMHGGKGKYGQFRSWFGIGVQIESPNLSQGFISRFSRVVGFKGKPLKIERTAWTKADVVCRRLKSRVVGAVSGELKFEVLSPPLVEGQSRHVSEGAVHVVSSGPLADGCPSALSSSPSEPPMVSRGGVANAPAMWLLPPRGQLDKSCDKICAKLLPSDTAKITIDTDDLGKVHSAASQIAVWYKGPRSVGRLRRHAWVGAFFDRELRHGNRFPLAALGRRFGDSAGHATDLRGAFASVPATKALGGVFVATQGPAHASNLLLPEPLLNDYLTHLPAAYAIAAAMPVTDEPPFVPSPAAAPRAR